MKDRQNPNPYFAGGVYRIVWAVTGLLFVGLGICVMFYGVVGLPIRIGAGVLLTLLGLDALWSSFQLKQSWLAKVFLFI